jgi:hypothetical protein
MPGFVIGSSASTVGEAWIGAADTAPSGGTFAPPHAPSGVSFPVQLIAFVFTPAALGSNGSASTPSARRAVSPAAWSNQPAIHTPHITLAVKSTAAANGQSFYTASLKRTLQTNTFANGPAFHGPRLTLRISPAAYASAGQVYSAAVPQSAAVKQAPHLASTATLFTPAIVLAVTTSITVTLSLPGLTPRASKPPQRRSTATWPNLPKVAAPPWRLTVVTPDIARERARERLAALKRTERLRRKRKVDERTTEIVDALIDEMVVRTIIDAMAEAG